MRPRGVDTLARMAVRVFKPAPSLKPRQKPKILAAHRDSFSVHTLTLRAFSARTERKVVARRSRKWLVGHILLHGFGSVPKFQ